jgi:hypothetical protein
VTKSRAIVTIVRDESVFLPIWLQYYGRFFAPEDTYVFDHGSTDGSTERGGFVRMPVEHETVDLNWMRRTVQAKQHELVERYDVVLVCDVDEIVAPHPDSGSLGDFIDSMDEEFVNCRGYEVLHQRDREPPIDLDQPLLKQRGSWFQAVAYSKPILASVPMRWFDGFHARQDGRSNFEYDLRLIHLHRLDYELCRARHQYRSEVKWSAKDVDSRYGYQNRIAAGDEFERWFYGDSGTHLPLELEPIPDEWRGVI